MVRIVASSWAQLVGKQDWNCKRKCPVLKNVTGGFLSVRLNLDWSALCWTLNHLNQARAGTGWVSASFWMLSLGFLLPECSAAAEMRHAWVSFPQSQAMTREGPRLGKLTITSASWGYNSIKIQDSIKNIITSLCLCTPLLPQAGQNRNWARWDTDSEGWWRRR